MLVSIPLCSCGKMDRTALKDLQSLLHSEKEWIKVHVAEYLIWEDHLVDEVKEVFLKENEQFGGVPKYRIGIWRVLAQASSDDRERQHWVGHILKAYHDEDGEDRLHAIETLAKLKYPVSYPDNLFSQIKEGHADPFVVYSLWNAGYDVNVGLDKVKTSCVALIERQVSENTYQLVPVVSYVLRFLGALDYVAWDQVYLASQQVKEEPSVYANLLATLWLTAGAGREDQALVCKYALLTLKDRNDAVMHVLMGLAERGDVKDLAMLEDWYTELQDANRPDYNADVHATAAYAIMKMKTRAGEN